MALINTIYEAIGDHKILSFSYKGEDRTAAPYIVGYDDRHNLVLSAVQLTGGSGKGFRNFKVDELAAVNKTDRRFSARHPDYNPRDPYFSHILKRV